MYQYVLGGPFLSNFRKDAWRLGVFMLSVTCFQSTAEELKDFLFLNTNRQATMSCDFGVSYQLEASADLTAPSWTSASAAVTGTGSGRIVMTATNDFSAQNFYRAVYVDSFPCLNSADDSCISAAYLGFVSGDRSSGFLCPSACETGPIAQGCGNAWFRVRLIEDSECPANLQINARLEVPSGVNYNLYLYDSCTNLVYSSESASGLNEQVVHVIQEEDDTDQSRNMFIEVRVVGGLSQSPWTLRTSGGNGPCY